jgi:hypothetical protein
MKKEKLHLLTIMAGLLLVVAIVCSQILQPRLTAQKNKQDTKTEQQKKDKGQNEEEQYINAGPSVSLPSSAQVHLNIDVYCLFDILCQEKPQETRLNESPLRPQKLLHTLFRVIIAPNAP